MSDPEFSRTGVLDPPTLDMLTAVSRGQQIASYPDIRKQLPTGLSLEEVNDVGLQVKVSVEERKLSWDGIHKGLRARRAALIAVAEAALLYGDVITVAHIVEHFRDEKGMGAKLSERRISRQLAQSMAAH